MRFQKFILANKVLITLFLIAISSSAYLYAQTFETKELSLPVKMEAELEKQVETKAQPIAAPNKQPADIGSVSVLGVANGGRNKNLALSSTTEKEEDTIQVTFNVPEISYKREIKIVKGSSVYDLMQKLKSEGSLNFTAQNYGALGVFVESIGNLGNDAENGKFWIYYLNGQTAAVGVSNYTLKQYDSITWQYENEKL